MELVSAFPLPPQYYKEERKAPPKIPTEYQCFGITAACTSSTESFKIRSLETQGLVSCIPEGQARPKEVVKSLLFSLLFNYLDLLKVAANNTEKV